MSTSDYTKRYYEEVAAVAAGIDQAAVERMIDILVDLRARAGRLFILGVGGGAGHAGHANIQDGCLGFLRKQQGQSLRSILGKEDAEAFGFEQSRKRSSCGALVLSNQYRGVSHVVRYREVRFQK